MKSAVIPEAWLKCMSPQDRKAIGQLSSQEALEAFTARNERQLQGQIVNLLRLKNIEVCWHRTDKKSAATVGWPDLTFAINGQAVAFEVKFGDGELSDEQEKMRIRLMSPPNCWCVRVIRSVQEVLKELREMGIE